MGSRDHSEPCLVCGVQRGGMNDLRCQCGECLCPFAGINRHEYGCSEGLNFKEGTLCNACDLPIAVDRDDDERDMDDACVRDKSYCKNKSAQVDWRMRALTAECEVRRLGQKLADAHYELRRMNE